MVRNVNQVSPPVSAPATHAVRTGDRESADFRKFLEGGLKLSKHVSQRIDRRQLDLGTDRLRMLKSAVDKAAAKGAKESLVLLDDLALLVSVKNRTVITAMNKSNMIGNKVKRPRRRGQ